MDTRTPKIAVIGPTHSGKTCLAVGLYCTSRPDLVISTPDQAIRNYLQERTVEVGHPKFPAATLSELKPPIEFDFDMQSASVRVSFREYPGEIISDEKKSTEFANAHWRDLDGVVLLVNPGAPAFQSGDPGLYEDTVSQYEKTIDFLSNPNNNQGASKPFMALTVTASDRLEGDLKGKLSLFEECLGHLSHLLNNKGFAWKRFDVTITGPLADQDKPSLADQSVISAANPFLWLIGCITERALRKRREEEQKELGKKALCRRRIWTAVAILAVLLAGYFMVGMHDAKTKLVAECTRTLSVCDETTCPSADKLDEAKTALLQLKKKAPKEAGKLLAQFGPSLERGFRERLGREINGLSEANAPAIETLFAAWAAIFPEGSAERDALKKKWQEQAYVLRGETAVKAQDLKGLAMCSPERTETDGFLTAEFVEQQWTGRFRSAYETEYRQFLLDVAANAKDGASGQPRLGDAEKTTIQRKAAEIGPPFDETAALAELRRLVDEASQNWAEEQQNKADRQHQACEDWVRANVNPKRERQKLFREYTRAQEKDLKGNPFFNEIVRAAVYRQAGQWLAQDIAYCSENGGEPLFGDTPQEFENWFNDFKVTCLEIAGDPDADKASWVYQFARLCKEKGHIQEGLRSAFPQTLTLTRFECNMDYHGKFPVNYKQTSFAAILCILDSSELDDSEKIMIMGGEDAPALQEKQAKQWISVWQGQFQHTLGLFAPMGLIVLAIDENDWWLSPNKVDDILDEGILGWEGDWFQGQPYRQFDCDFELNRLGSGDDVPRIGVRVYGKLETMTPESLLQEAKMIAMGQGK